MQEQLSAGRRAAILVVLPIILCACGTGEGETELRARFNSDPTGGELVQSMEAEFTMNREFTDNSGILESSPSPDDISVTVEWVSEQAGVFKTQRLTVDEGQETYQTSVSITDPNTYYSGIFFVRLTWNDDNGRREVESDRAICTVPDQSGEPTIAPNQSTRHLNQQQN